MLDQNNEFTREQMDAMVAEALCAFPEATIDPELANDPALAKEVSVLSDRVMPMLHMTIDIMCEKMENKSAMQLTEIGLAVLAPEIQQRIQPPIAIMAAAYAVAATGLMGLKYIADENITQDNLDIDKFLAYARENLNDVMAFLLSLPKKRFLTTLLFFLEGHLKSINKLGDLA